MLNFDETTHTYTTEDGKHLISVTQLMQKHGLAPKYDAVPSEVLRAKAERGTLIHKEIETYIKTGEIGFTAELSHFIKATKENNTEIKASELMLYNDIVAGTADLVLCQDGTYIIADIKTTATLHKEAVSWQLSIYAYLFNNGKDIKVTKGQAYHFDKNGDLKIVDITLKPVEEIKRLMDCEKLDIPFLQKQVLTVKQLVAVREAQIIITQADKLKKQADAILDEVKASIMQAMETNAVKSFENDCLKITYVDATTRASIDSTKLKKEMPDIAKKYEKTSQVKASLKITLKEQKTNE